MTDTHGALWMTLSSGIATLVSLVLYGAMLAVVLTVVRRNKPAAVMSLAAAAVINLVTTVVSPIAYAVVPVLARSEGNDHYQLVFAAMSLGMTLIHTISGVLLIVGLAKLAAPEAAGRLAGSAGAAADAS